MPPLLMSACSLPQRLARYLAVGALVPAALLAGHHRLPAGIILALLLLAASLRWFLRRPAPPGLPSDSQQLPTHSSPQQAPAQQDQLTGIANREALDARLEEEWKRERRAGEPTALILVAVDAFAALADESGPLAGDVALLTLARALTRQLPRRADLLARYNQSTFAVLLPGTDLPGTLRVTARLRWAIVRLGIAHPGAASGILTASFGVCVQHGLIGHGAQALLTAAEDALRSAQQGGADRIEYVALQGEDHASPALTLTPLRAWTPDRTISGDTLHPTQG